MIKSSSVVISPVPSLSNSQYLVLSFSQCMNCTIDSVGCCLVSRNFVLSIMTNLFFGLIFLFITLPISLKVSSSRFLGSSTVETLWITLHPAVAGSMSVISFCFPSFCLSLSFFTLKASYPCFHMLRIVECGLTSYQRCHCCALEILCQAS